MLWGFYSTVWGQGTEIPYSGFTAVCLALGRAGHSVGLPVHPVWCVLVPVQCSPFGTPCALCFQAASAWPEQQRNLLRLRGRGPGLGLPPDPTFRLLACCGQNQPLGAEVGLLPWGFHQGWVTRRGPRGKEGAQPALPGGCCLGLGQPLAGSLGTAPLQWVLFVHGVPGMASWSGGAHLGGLLQLEGLNPLGCEAWRGSKGCHGVGAWQGEQRGAMARLEAVGSVLAGGLWLPWLHQAFRGKILKSAGQHFWPDPIISSANPLGPPKQFVSCFSSSPISWDPTSHLPSM